MLSEQIEYVPRIDAQHGRCQLQKIIQRALHWAVAINLTLFLLMERLSAGDQSGPVLRILQLVDFVRMKREAPRQEVVTALLVLAGLGLLAHAEERNAAEIRGEHTVTQST